MISPLLITIIGVIAFAVLAPAAGCLLAGLDRKVSARMQGRVGPPLLQPYYDVRKLLVKENASVNGAEGLYIAAALGSTMVAGGIFFTGGNFLLCVFLVTLSALFFVLAAYCTRSPYAEAGAHRELAQVMSYEPMVLLVAVGLFMVTGSFDVSAVLNLKVPLALPGILFLVGFLFVLTIKVRKSPFDLSYSHHAHQDLVKGVSTEMSGPTLAKVEVMHWCENVLFLGWVGMFFVWGGPVTLVAGVAAALIAWFLEILIDNNFARVRWQFMVKGAWVTTTFCGLVNMAALVLV